MRWAALALLLLLPAAQAAETVRLHPQPDGQHLGMAALDGSLDASCEGTPAMPAWAVEPHLELGALLIGLRLVAEEIPLQSASLTWIFDAPAGAAGPTATLEAAVSMDSEVLASGTSAPFVIVPGRNDVEFPLGLDAHAIPARSRLSLQVRLVDTVACTDLGDGALSASTKSFVAFDAPRTHRLESTVKADASRVWVGLDYTPNWGAYDSAEPTLYLSMKFPNGTALPQEVADSKDEARLTTGSWDGRRGYSWGRGVDDAQPGRYKGVATAWLESTSPPIILDAPIEFRITESGEVQSLPAVAEEPTPMPALPLPLLAGLLLALAYSSAKRSATALRTSLPW